LSNCCVAGVPKCFSVGITVMYLEICEGYKVKIK